MGEVRKGKKHWNSKSFRNLEEGGTQVLRGVGGDGLGRFGGKRPNKGERSDLGHRTMIQKKGEKGCFLGKVAQKKGRLYRGSPEGYPRKKGQERNRSEKRKEPFIRGALPEKDLGNFYQKDSEREMLKKGNHTREKNAFRGTWDPATITYPRKREGSATKKSGNRT